MAHRQVGSPGARSAKPGDPCRHDKPDRRRDARKITATLFFVSEDGMALVGVQREVAFGETVLDQARQIVASQLAMAPRSARLGDTVRRRRCGRCT